jgi:uncharacterized protein YyaL (SSP411 family)
MNAVVTMSGQGGWPMSVFLTPEGQPFYGGTYFPPARMQGLPSFREVLLAAAQAWKKDPGELRRTGGQLTQQLENFSSWGDGSGQSVRPELSGQAAQALLSSYDWKYGGWGRAPRFPQPMSLEFLLLQATRGNKQALEAVRHNLGLMNRGGIYDVIGGGFARYSTDDHWLVPHFEKMLYDNAQLALVYLHAGLLSGDHSLIQTCTETLDFILRELTNPEGGFYSSLDADSEGEEGKFYLWTTAEVKAILEPAGLFDLFQQAYPLTNIGNDEELIILRRRAALPDLADVLGIPLGELTSHLNKAHQALFVARQGRIRPLTDDKVLVAWNALALRVFAEAARYLHRPDYLEAAQKNARFLLSALRPDGHLCRAWRAGKARHNAYLEDYAGLILALLALYQSDPNPLWFENASELAAEMEQIFTDPAGGFFDTRADPELITRPKNYEDNATPCGNSLAAYALLTLSEYTGQPGWRAKALEALPALQDAITRHPTAFGLWLQVVDFAAGPIRQVAIVGPASSPRTEDLVSALWEKYRPRLVAAFNPGAEPVDTPALLQDRIMLDDRPAAYVCEEFTCKLPVTSPEDLADQL